jgi:phage terminase large subunit-like protein
LRLPHPAIARYRAQAHKPHKTLIEDACVGMALVSELKCSGLTAIAVKQEQSKIIRMSIESAKFEAGFCVTSNAGPHGDA